MMFVWHPVSRYRRVEALKMADITDFINREVSVYISRSGQVVAVAVGNDQSVELPPVEGRRGKESFKWCALRAYSSRW